MDIYFNSFSSKTISLFKENISPSLTSQQKKIVIIVSIALGGLAVCYYAINYFWFKKHIIDIEGSWWLEINKAQKLMEFKKDWKNLTDSNVKCDLEAKGLQGRCKGNFYTQHDPSHLYDTALGTVYGVPNRFSMWMPGVAFIASYLAAKKNINGLFVCQTLEAFSTQLKEIALSDEDQRCAFIVGSFQAGLRNQYSHFEPNFPQHKATVCVEKKGGQLTIALLESEPLVGLNDEIDPAHLTDDLWDGYENWNTFNNQELVFRAILKACRFTKCDATLLSSQVIRQIDYGCETFALSDAISYLRDPDFFNKITCSTKTVTIDPQYQVEYISQLPPEFMIGTQSYKRLQDYLKIANLNPNQPLFDKKKTFQDYIDANRVEVSIDDSSTEFKPRNYYIVKKSFKYLIFLIESLNILKPNEIEQITEKTLLTKIDKNLFPDSDFKSEEESAIILESSTDSNFECGSEKSKIILKDATHEVDERNKPIKLIV